MIRKDSSPNKKTLVIDPPRVDQYFAWALLVWAAWQIYIIVTGSPSMEVSPGNFLFFIAGPLALGILILRTRVVVTRDLIRERIIFWGSFGISDRPLVKKSWAAITLESPEHGVEYCFPKGLGHREKLLEELRVFFEAD